MSEQTIANGLNAATEADKAEFAQFLMEHGAFGEDAAATSARFAAAFDRFIAERLGDR